MLFQKHFNRNRKEYYIECMYWIVQTLKISYKVISANLKIFDIDVKSTLVEVSFFLLLSSIATALVRVICDQ